MRILLIGTVVKDKIIFLNGKQVSSFGGLTHSISAALAICEPSDYLIPVSRVGSDIYMDFINYWEQNKNFCLDGFIPYNQNNNTVELNYIDTNERIEKSLYPMPPLQFEEIERFLDVDLVMVNLISGWDVELEFMLKLRAAFTGLIAIDIHSLTLQRLPDGTRKLRPVPHIQPWLQSADMIQLNDREYEMISDSEQDPEVFFMQTCAQTDKIINLTKGAHGSESFRIKNSHCEVINTSPFKKLRIVDPIGCGDTFFAIFGINYFKTKDFKFSAKRANKVAAIAGSMKGLANPAKLRNKISLFSREEV